MDSLPHKVMLLASKPLLFSCRSDAVPLSNYLFSRGYFCIRLPVFQHLCSCLIMANSAAHVPAASLVFMLSVEPFQG